MVHAFSHSTGGRQRQVDLSELQARIQTDTQSKYQIPRALIIGKKTRSPEKCVQV